jgi:anti-sigma-K factor RskA
MRHGGVHGTITREPAVESGTQLREYGQPAPDHTSDAESQAGLYAFGILQGAELARFERHLSVCGRCAEVVDGDKSIVSTLSLTAPEMEPSAGFKERLLAQAAAEVAARTTEGTSADAGGVGVTPFHPRRARSRQLAWLLPLAAVIVALLVGGGLLSRQIAAERIVAMAPLDNRAGRGHADVVIRASGEGVIQLDGFDDLPDGRVYQAWVIRPGSAPLATGASARGDGTLTLDGDVRGSKVAVTLEPGPGATAPSRPPFVIGDAPA